jgi:CheY-like chemotaxis protein
MLNYALPFSFTETPGSGGAAPRNRPRGHGGSSWPVGPPAVLLVEDDAQLAEMYRLRLERSNIDVTIASDGEEALKLAGTLAYDLVLMDLGLPKRGGLEVIKMLRSDPATAAIPMVVLSNYSEPGMMKEGLDLGILAYLVKADTTPSKLVASVLDWLKPASS